MTTATAPKIAATATTRSRFARRFAVAAVMVVAPVLGLALSPGAEAKSVPAFPNCGNPNDNSTIWNGVKPDKYTPTNKGSNRDIQWPNGDSSRGWAVHDGQYKPTVDTDLLVVPTVRETGIECTNLLSADAPEYFTHAYDEIHLLPKGTDWALAVNSEDSRGQDQLHIHLTRLYAPTRTDIDTAAKTGKLGNDEYAWRSSVVELTGHNQQGKQTTHAYRTWNAGSMNHNFFAKLNEEIVKPLQAKGAGMSHETILITANHQGPGFVVLESDVNTTLPNGVNNMETLLNKG